MLEKTLDKNIQAAKIKIVIDKSFLPHKPGDNFTPDDNWTLWIPDTLIREIAIAHRNDLAFHLKDKNFEVLEHVGDLINEEIKKSKSTKKIASNELTERLKKALQDNFNVNSINIDKENITSFKEMIKNVGTYSLKCLKETLKEGGQKCSIIDYLKSPDNILHDNLYMLKIIKDLLKGLTEYKSSIEQLSDNFFTYQYIRALFMVSLYRCSKGNLLKKEEKIQNEMRDVDYLPYIYYADGFACNDKILREYAEILYPKKLIFPK